MSTAANGQGGTPANGQGAPAGGPGERATPKRGPGPAPGGMRHGPAAFMGGMSTEKSLDFRGSSTRLLRAMRPERALAILALTLTEVSVTLDYADGDAAPVTIEEVLPLRFWPATELAAVVRLAGGLTVAGRYGSFDGEPPDGPGAWRMITVLRRA